MSHITRFGLNVHGGADFVNPGFGKRTPSPLTLELFNCNASPLTLTAGMPIIHLRLEQLAFNAEAPWTSVSIYEGADPLGGPKLFEEWAPDGHKGRDG